MKSLKGQAIPNETIQIPPEAFLDNNDTSLYWLGEAGVMVNSHGTILLIDPVISIMPASIVPGKGWVSEVNGTRCLRVPPIQAALVERLDAVLYTHSDDDHLGLISAPMMRSTGCVYHSTRECTDRLKGMGIPEKQIVSHPKLDRFQIGCVTVQMTLANHPWQKSEAEVFKGWHFTEDDCTGFKLYTPDGVIWIPGDTLPLPEHLENGDVDVMFADFSDDPFHYGSQKMIELCNHLTQAELIAYHWGTLDLPDFLPQNADPYAMQPSIRPKDRLHILAPGERYVLKKRG